MEALWHSAAKMQTQILEQIEEHSCFQSTCLSLSAAAAAAATGQESKCLTFHINVARYSQSQLWHFRSLNYLLLEASLSITGCLRHRPFPLTHMVTVAGPSPPTHSVITTSKVRRIFRNPSLASTKWESVTWPTCPFAIKRKIYILNFKTVFHFVFFSTKILLLMVLAPSPCLAEILACVTGKPLPSWQPPKSLKHFLFEAQSLWRKY